MTALMNETLNENNIEASPRHKEVTDSLIGFYSLFPLYTIDGIDTDSWLLFNKQEFLELKDSIFTKKDTMEVFLNTPFTLEEHSSLEYRYFQKQYNYISTYYTYDKYVQSLEIQLNNKSIFFNKPLYVSFIKDNQLIDLNYFKLNNLLLDDFIFLNFNHCNFLDNRISNFNNFIISYLLHSSVSSDFIKKSNKIKKFEIFDNTQNTSTNYQHFLSLIEYNNNSLVVNFTQLQELITKLLTCRDNFFNQNITKINPENTKAFIQELETILNISSHMKLNLLNFLSFEHLKSYDNIFVENFLSIYNPIKELLSYLVIDKNLISENVILENQLKNSEKFLPKFFDLYSDKSKIIFLSNNSKETNNKDFFNDISAGKRQKKLMSSASNLIANIDKLYYSFPHFQEVIAHIEGMIRLQEHGDNAFYVPPLLMVGGPGVGKTFFSSILAELVGTNLVNINTQSVTANFVLMGGNGQWANAEAGLIFKTLFFNNANTINPIILLDELEKANGSQNYQVANSLLPLLEQHSAKNFQDEFIPISIDASYISWLATANSLNGISAPLLSRFDVFHIPNPSLEDRKILVSNIYKSILSQKSWGNYFNPNLPEDSLYVLANQMINGGARDLRKILSKSFANAVLQKSLEIRPEHIQLTNVHEKAPWDL